MPVTRLIYYSENQLNAADGSIVSQLQKILSASNRNNRSKNITGALVFDDLWFFQALEGEADAVWETFERIKEDERHANVRLKEMREDEDRIFGNWWMGLATRNEATKSAFLPFLVNGRLQPKAMSAQEILTLMVEVSKLGLKREIASLKVA